MDTAINGFHHVKLPVADLARSRDWYARVLGLQITAPAGFEDFIAEVGRPAQRPGLPEPTEPDIPRLAAAAQRYGYQILGPPPAPPSR